MSDPQAVALQMNPLSDYLAGGLAERFAVCRWFELDAAARESWLAQHAGRVRAVVAGGEVGCSNELMAALPALGIITINGVGLDRVDLAYASSRGIRVTTTPGLLTEDVADLAVGLVIALLRGIAASDAFVRAGRWELGAAPLARKVSGRRFGIVGLGRIGTAIAQRLESFGPIAYTGPHRKAVSYEFHADIVEFARRTDVLVLACPATSATRRLIDARVLDALGPRAYLVNVARGAVVDEPALIAALQSGRLCGAALDVFEDEPRVPHALRTSEKVVLTPHVASATVETRTAMADLVLANLDAFLGSRALPSAVC